MFCQRECVLTFQVKNPDGTTTTRTAGGAKITRPGLKRNTNSANRLAAVAANNAVAKLQPLTRSKTADPAPTHDHPATTPQTPSPNNVTPGPFQSAIYCSSECAQADAGRSDEVNKALARTMSYDFSAPQPRYGLQGLVTHGLPVSDHANPYAPPSPLFISGSDTESSIAGGPESGPSSSAPKNLGFFRMSKERPDEAWHEVQRQRRSSMNPAVRPISLARQQSNVSVSNHGWADASSDSLSSLWHNTSEYDALARSVSNGPKPRNVSFVEREPTRRSMSSSSDRSAPIPAARPSVSRSNLSHTSLAASPSQSGSAPDQSLNLLNSYAAGFSSSKAAGSAHSYTKGFAHPGSGSSHGSGVATPLDSRRGSINAATIQRPLNGTIRAKSRQARPETAPTWDSFGRDTINAVNARAAARAVTCPITADTLEAHEHDCTPKQSLEVQNGQWQVKHGESRPMNHRSRSSASDTSSTSRRSSNTSSTGVHRASPGMPIRHHPLLSTSVSSTHGRTPLASGTMAPPAAIPIRSNTTPSSSVPTRASSNVHLGDNHPLPDLAALRIGSSGCAPYLSTDAAKGGRTRSGFDWTAHEHSGGKLYTLPKGLKVDRSKAGLFYFE